MSQAYQASKSVHGFHGLSLVDSMCAACCSAISQSLLQSSQAYTQHPCYFGLRQALCHQRPSPCVLCTTHDGLHLGCSQLLSPLNVSIVEDVLEHCLANSPSLDRFPLSLSNSDLLLLSTCSVACSSQCL